MNIYQVYGRIGPWATPAPAAIALAGRLFGEWAKTDLLTAWGVALFSLTALEVAGGLCSYQMIRTSLDRRWGWFALCLLGVFTYVGLGVYALWGLTAWIYVVLAVFVHIAVAAELATNQQRVEVVEDKTLTLALEKERTKQANAEARKAKAEQIVFPRSFGQESVRPVRTEQNEQSELQIKVFAILDEDKNIGPREMSRRVRCAPSTAKTYIDRWHQQKQIHQTLIPNGKE